VVTVNSILITVISITTLTNYCIFCRVPFLCGPVVTVVTIPITVTVMVTLTFLCGPAVTMVTILITVTAMATLTLYYTVLYIFAGFHFRMGQW
jgi:hypothetical protein